MSDTARVPIQVRFRRPAIQDRRELKTGVLREKRTAVMDKRLILIIEDSESDAGLVIREFHKANYEITAERVETADGMRSALARQSWDLIISDYNLPEFDAPAALAIFRESGLDIPFIVVSGAIGEETAVAIMIAGAHDYVMKKNLARLLPAVERELVEAQVRRSKRQAEGALRSSEEKYRRIIETSKEGIVVLDENFKFTFVNARFAEILGYSPEELIGIDVARITFEEDMPEVSERRKRRRQGISEPYERRFRRKDGSTVWTHISMTAMMDENGRFEGAFAMHTDITGRKQSEEALRKSEEKYRHIIETSQEGIVIVDENFNFTFVNERFVKMLGYGPEELIGTDPLYIVFEEDIPEFLERRKERSHGISQQYDRRFRRKDGTVLWTHASITAMMDENGQFLGAFAMYTDITQRKQAEEALNRSTEKLRRNLAGTIQAMSMMVEIRDPYTSGHQSRVSKLARYIGQGMGLPGDLVDSIRMAGIIHDIGKMAIPAEILSKPTRLTELEMDLIRVHPEAGYEILKNADLPYPIAQMILQHHERLDGSGYPQGLKNGQILLESQIISVADVVEAIASHRPYRPALGIDVALEEIERKKGVFYDPDVVEACLGLFREKGFKFE